MVYCIDETCDEPIMLILSHIGFDEEDGMGVDGAQFMRELLYLDSLGKKRIQVWINSVGGRVMDGYNIGAGILKTKTPVDTYNVGVAASIAGVIFMCGRNRVALDYSLWMTHNVSANGEDDSENPMQASLTKLIAAKSHLDPETVNGLMNVTTWLNAEECLEKGIATGIEYTEESNKKRMRTAVEATDKWKEAAKITNSILNKNTKQMADLTKVTNKLQLNPDANQDAILSGIEAIENKAKNDILAVENKSASEKKALQDKIDKMEADLKELKDAKDALEDEAKTEKATNMVKGYAEGNRIKNEDATIAKWVGLAKADFEGTKNMLEELPINGEAVKIEIDANNIAKTPEDFMYAAMKEIKNKTTKKQ